MRVFDSFDEENAAEHRRLAAMSPEERMREFGVLQGRHFGQSWGSTPIEKQVTWEKVSW